MNELSQPFHLAFRQFIAFYPDYTVNPELFLACFLQLL